ncbi:hypothetical protein [Kordia sp.]|uniref:hypothetical protein n=1 Tax=Kordia sp. TaxID=1965332 RepID=UPI003D6BF3CF
MEEKHKIDPEYIRLLNSQLHRKYPEKKIKDFRKIFDIGPTTYHNLFNNFDGVKRTVNHIASKCEFTSYDDYLLRKPILTNIKKTILKDGGFWVSYCFTKDRRLYQCIWEFKEKKREYSDETYIEALRDSDDFKYKGELTINTDLTLSIQVKTNPNYKIDYFSIFSDDKEATLLENFSFMTCDAKAIRGRSSFTTLEVFAKLPSNHNLSFKRIYDEAIKMNIGPDGVPTNPAYLAFNYLTRYVSKSRRSIDNFIINQKPKHSGYLNYKQEIHISCPVSFIEEREDFDYLKNITDSIIKVLIEDYNFHENNIYCEISEYDSFDKINKDDRHLFFKSREHINATHYIGLLPKSLEKRNSGVYMEIYFRVLKKLPAVIFVEDRKNLPSLLRGLLDANRKPININFKDYELSEVANYMKASKDYLFQFSL